MKKNNFEGDGGVPGVFRKLVGPLVAAVGLASTGQAKALDEVDISRPVATAPESLQESLERTIAKIEGNLMSKFKDAFAVLGVTSVEVDVSSSSKKSALTVTLLGSKSGEQVVKYKKSAPLSEGDVKNFYALEDVVKNTVQTILNEHLPETSSQGSFLGNCDDNDGNCIAPTVDNYNISSYENSSHNASYAPSATSYSYTSPAVINPSATSYSYTSPATTSYEYTQPSLSMPPDHTMSAEQELCYKTITEIGRDINSELKDQIEQYGKGAISLRTVLGYKKGFVTIEVLAGKIPHTALAAVDVSEVIASNPSTLKALLVPLITKGLSKEK